MKRLIPYAQLVRLPNTFTAMADIFLGALATGLLFQRWYVAICLLASSTLLYWSGMIWNDYKDVNQDRKERPSRPLASGRVSMGAARLLAIALTFGGLFMAVLAGFRIEAGNWLFDWRPFVIALLLVIAIMTYDGVLGKWLAFFAIFIGLIALVVVYRLGQVYPALAWLRTDMLFGATIVVSLVSVLGLVVGMLQSDIPLKATLAGPVFMGLCRFLNILLGLTILTIELPQWGWLLALVIGIYIAGVTWFARTEAQTSSQPMLIGAASAMLVALLLALTVPALVLERTNDREPSWLFPYLLAGFGCYLGIAVLAAIRRPEPSRVQPVIKRAIMGLVVLDALLASAFVGSLGLLLVVLLVPGMILGRWLYST
ncbi:MAG: UbiA family prenyltransferase [Planctomycetes bacterium]|nr:UbiA family prenyltransferase [Planctomycetota bacterium]